MESMQFRILGTMTNAVEHLESLVTIGVCGSGLKSGAAVGYGVAAV
jgi:hypothetical protein